MKEKKCLMILLFILICKTVSFYSCRINNSNSKKYVEYEKIEIVVKNETNSVYYFNERDIKNSSCDMYYKDDKKRIKDIYFSLTDEILSDIPIIPSSFSFRLEPRKEIRFFVRLTANLDDYYETSIYEDSKDFSPRLVGKAFEKYFFMFCSKEIFGFKNYMEYCKNLKRYGIKLEGTQIGEKTISFVIKDSL